MSSSLQPHKQQHDKLPCPSLSPQSLLRFMSIELVMLLTITSYAIPFFFLQSFLISQYFPMSQLFQSGGQSIRVSASATILPMMFRVDFLQFDLLVVQGTLESILQNRSSKTSILWHSVFFILQLSHPYTTTGKTIALTRQTFVGKVMSLLLNMLSRLVITFLPKSKRLLISWLQSPFEEILEPQRKSATLSPSICHEVMRPDTMIFVY